MNSLHPATYMPTKMVLESVGYSVDSLETGLAATMRLIHAPELNGVTGRFFDRTRAARAHPDAFDPALQQQVWELSARLTEQAHYRRIEILFASQAGADLARNQRADTREQNVVDRDRAPATAQRCGPKF